MKSSFIASVQDTWYTATRFIRMFLQRANTSSPRERLLFLCLGIIFIWAIFDFVFFQSQKNAFKAMTGKIDALRQETLELQKQASSLVNTYSKGPIGEIRHKQEELKEKITHRDAEIERFSEQSTPAGSIMVLIEQMIQSQAGLHLIEMRSLPKQRLLTKVKEQSQHQQEQKALFLYPLRLVFEGGYFDTLRFLQNLERLQWRPFWDELEYQVMEYPKGRVTLKLYTLSEESIPHNDREPG